MSTSLVLVQLTGDLEQMAAPERMPFLLMESRPSGSFQSRREYTTVCMHIPYPGMSVIRLFSYVLFGSSTFVIILYVCTDMV